MSKPVRSPLTGYNHNVQYLGRVFHVQTEDSGPINPHIFTHLFFGGTILVSKKHRYEATTPDETVRKLMQAQHKSMLRELVQTQHDERIRGFFAAKGEVLPVEMPGAQPAAAMPTVESQPNLSATPITNTPPPLRMDVSLTPAPKPLSGAGSAPLRMVDNSGRTPPPSLLKTPPPLPVAAQGGTPAPVVSSHVVGGAGSGAGAAQPAPARIATPSSTSPRLAPPGSRPPAAAGQQVVRPSPYARGGQQTVANSSADGVVIQRSIVVGSQRQRPAQSAEATPSRATAAFRVPGPATATPPPVTVGQAAPPAPQVKVARGTTPSSAGHHPNGTPTWGASVTPAPTGAATAVRPMGALVDDKSLDEVILEYLADDAVDEGLG